MRNLVEPASLHLSERATVAALRGTVAETAGSTS